MRFRLIENRIDDLMKRIQNKDLDTHDEDNIDPFEQKKKQDLIKHIENTCTIDLLGVKEAKKIGDDIESGLLKENILIWPESKPNWWWLRDSGYFSYSAMYVYNDGYISCDGCPVDNYPGCVRPVLHLISSVLNLYEYYTVYNEQWIAVSEDTLLYDGAKYVEHIFDKETNNYEDSEIKQYVENQWLIDIKDPSKYNVLHF